MAKDYFQSDEFNELLDFYERRKKKRKSIYLDAEDFADLADYYLSNDCPLSAMEAVDTGLAIHFDSEVLLVMKSAIHIYQFKFAKAEAILSELDERNPDVMYQLAQLQYAYYLDIPKAEKMWRKWLQMESEDADGDYLRENYIHIISTIAVLREPGDASDERKCIAEALRRWVREYIDIFKPLGKHESDVQLADICRENELPDLLGEVLSQVLEEQPYLHKGWSTLALAYYVQTKYEQALEACAFALAINPNDMEALLTKAYALYDMDDRDGAKPVFKEYIDNGGDSMQMLPYAEMLFRDNECEEALEQLDVLAQYLEQKKEELTRRKENATKQLPEECKKARKAYDDFMELYKKVLNDMGELCYQNGCYEESYKAYVRLIDAGCYSSETYYMIGLNHLATNNLHAATCSFGLALSNADDKVMTGIDIAMTFSINNYDEMALKVLETVDKLAEGEECASTKNIAAIKSLSYLKLGDTKQFLTFFKMACTDSPELIKHVYGRYFPADVPVSEWYTYAKREMNTLLKKIIKDDVHITGF